ncbi:MAG: acyl-CoA dehydrogenase family protein, partial [Dehalococcoidia bacterium]|nr:acyl-CoA dehydrogenase family protein [Dehalococcoidia bacterium]
MAGARDPITKYSQGGLATEKDIMLANALHEYIDKQMLVGDVRQNLDGGFHRDERLAKKTFDEVVKGLIKLDCARAWLPKKYGGLGVESNVTYCVMMEELGRGDLGVAEPCLEIVEDYTKDRFIAGKPVRERSLFAAKIGKMAMQIRAARAYSMYIASMFDHPELYGETSSTPQVGRAASSKVFSTST